MTTANIISPVNVEDRKALGIKPGDTVRVSQKIEEKGKTRIQVFEGLALATKHGSEAGATFTVRRVSGGIGIEKIFPLYSPAIDKIEIVRRAKVRRAKLYYIREKVARQIRRQMRNMKMVDLSTESEIEAKEALVKAEEEEVNAKAEVEKETPNDAEDPKESNDSDESASGETADSPDDGAKDADKSSEEVEGGKETASVEETKEEN